MTKHGLPPGGDYETFAYDVAGNLVQKRTRAGDILQFAFDALSRQTAKTGAAVVDTATTYDLTGRPVLVSGADGQSLAHAYDGAGRLVSVTDQLSRVVSYQYDAASNRVRLTWADGYFVDYSYDGLNRMVTAKENGSFTLSTFAYDVRSRPVSASYGNGTSTALGYEQDDDLISISHGFVSGGWPLTGGGTGVSFAYAYSKAAKLKSQDANQAALLWEPAGVQTIAYAVNSLNQYTTVTTDGAPAAIAHDNNGNLTGDGTDGFAYDPENRLVSAAMGSGTNVAYLYDPMGRRARKTVDGVVTDYLHDDIHVIAEYDGAGVVLRRYVYGPGTDRPIAMVEGGAGSYTRGYYHADRLGSVIALTDDSGAETARYTYDSYGAPYLVDPGTGAQTQVAAGQRSAARADPPSEDLRGPTGATVPPQAGALASPLHRPPL